MDYYPPPIFFNPQQENTTPHNNSTAHLDPLTYKGKINLNIQKHRELSAADHLNMSDKLSPAAKAISTPEISNLYHIRDPELNQLKLFFSGYETEIGLTH